MPTATNELFPPKILKWLHQRGITDEIIESSKIFWDEQRQAITIPIFNTEGSYLFNKFRRDPFDKGKPKYWNEKGASAQLYGYENPHKRDKYVIVCEGEFDCLVLHSKGFNAVTSTSGAGTFRDEWLPLLARKTVYFIYDNDLSGLQGMQKHALKFPSADARIVILPGVGNHGDITDYFQKYGKEDFDKVLLENSIMLPDWDERRLPKNKGEAKKLVKMANFQLNQLVELEREISRKHQKRVELNYVRSYFNNQKNKLNRFMSPRERADMKDDIEAAKAVPLDQLHDGELQVEGNRARGLCPFHMEKTPSFVIYLDENRYFCFGCDSGYDPIDFIINRDNCDFKTAVQTLKVWRQKG